MPGSQPRYIAVSESDDDERQIYFDLRQSASPLSIATGEAGGQPEISTDGGSWTSTGIGVLVHVGRGIYTALLTQNAVASVGAFIKTRYVSGNVVETPGESVYVVPDRPSTDFVTQTANEVVNLLKGSTGVVVLPTTSSQMTLSNAIEIARSALNDRVGDSDTTEDLRQAIRTVTSDFLNRTKINSTVATFVTTPGEPNLDLSSIAGFRSERFMSAQIDFKPLFRHTDYDTVSDILNTTSENGTPDTICFQTATSAFVSPRPTTGISIKIRYTLAGTDLTSDEDKIQIPSEYLRPAIWWGVQSLIRSASMEGGDDGNSAWLKYIEVVRQASGFVGSGSSRLSRDLSGA